MKDEIVYTVGMKVDQAQARQAGETAGSLFTQGYNTTTQSIAAGNVKFKAFNFSSENWHKNLFDYSKDIDKINELTERTIEDYKWASKKGNEQIRQFFENFITNLDTYTKQTQRMLMANLPTNLRMDINRHIARDTGGVEADDNSIPKAVDLTQYATPADTARLRAMAESTAKIHNESENVVQSFWSVWSISWMIRGSLQNIFGYTSKWVGEVNKVTRAFQSGLYMYAGMGRIASSLTKKVLQENQAWKDSEALQKTIAYRLRPMILRIQNDIVKGKASDIKITKEQVAEMYKQGIIDDKLQAKLLEREYTEAKLLPELKLQTKEYQAQIGEKKELAMQSTSATRAFLSGGFMKIISGVAIASVLIGVVQWISSMNKETNKSVTDMKSLNREIQSLKNPLSTVKTSFTTIDGLIQKITKDFPDMADQFDKLEDPAKKLGLAFAFIAEQSIKPMGFTGELKNYIKKDYDAIMSYIRDKEMIARATGVMGGSLENISSYQDITKAIIKQKDALFGLNEQQNMYANETALSNALLGAQNKQITDNLKTTKGLKSAWDKYSDSMIRATAVESTKDIMKKYNHELKIQQDLLNKTTDAQKRKMIIDEIERINKEKIITAEQAVSNFRKIYNTLYGDLTKETENASSAAPMTWVAYYTDLYNSYKTAAKNDSKYTNLSLKNKNLLINALKNEIASLNSQMKAIGSVTEKYKKLNIQKAKDIQQLTELINLREKLNSTWYNIPSAIIKPTQSQLTSANVYMSPQFNINGQTIEELKEEMHKTIDQYDWEQGMQNGNEGNAIP